MLSFLNSCAYIEIEDGGDGFTAPQAFTANMGGDTCSTGYQGSAICKFVRSVCEWLLRSARMLMNFTRAIRPKTWKRVGVGG